jgi:hypothetical protein
VYAQHLDGESRGINVDGDEGGWGRAIPLDGTGWREVTLPLDRNPGKIMRIHLHLRGLQGDDNGKANRDLDPAAKLCLDDMRLE